MKDRLIGLDMNGWHDFAVRSWLRDRDGIDQPVPNGYFVDGGTLSRVVEVGDETRTTVGGPRAQMAIHGRGPGWGDFGDEERRVLLKNSDDPKAWGVAMRELGAEPRIAVLAVPDEPSMNEDLRETRLEAMRSVRARRTMLVWSSVALALTECTAGTIEAGHKLGIVELGAEGIRVQILDIIERDGLLTPRRRLVGRKLASRLGLAAREAAAVDLISSGNIDARIARALRFADLPALLAMSSPGETLTELVRLENGDWFEATGNAPDISFDLSLTDVFTACTRVLLHGPCHRGLLEEIAVRLQQKCDAPIAVLSEDAAARGAFLVAERLRLGQPPWFDYLPNIETIVQDQDGAASLSLVGSDEVAEAGKVWRSGKPVPLAWQAKSERIEVWLKKEDDPTPRSSPSVVQAGPAKDERVLLFLEQEPAQGRARLRITSDTWAELRDRPTVVDWEAGRRDETGRSWETIIADFSVRPPVVPERVILPAHRDLWYSDQGVCLADALNSFNGRDYKPIYQALSSRRQVYYDQPDHPQHRRKFYAIDSDGGRPKGVRDRDWERLLEVLDQAEVDFTTARVENNDALGVLSWSFRLCPPTVWPIVLSALNGRGGAPVFAGWKTMYPQALGRIASGQDAFIGAIDYLSRQTTPWNKNQQACSAFLLSRNDEVFDFVDKPTIEQWSESAILSLREGLASGFTARHQYLPILIAGLLRWRLRERFSFTAGHGPNAEEIEELLESVIKLSGLTHADLTAYQAVLSAFRDQGSRPDLLQTLFDLL